MVSFLWCTWSLALLLLYLDVLVAQPVPQACCFGDGVARYGSECLHVFPPVASWDAVQKCWQVAAQHFGNKTSVEQYQIFSIFLGSASLSASTYNNGIPQINGNLSLIHI